MVMYYSRPVIKNYQSTEELDYAKPRLEVEYVNVNTNPLYDKKQFSIDKYLKKENKKWQLTPAYASAYVLYDQTGMQLK